MDIDQMIETLSERLKLNSTPKHPQYEKLTRTEVHAICFAIGYVYHVKQPAEATPKPQPAANRKR